MDGILGELSMHSRTCMPYPSQDLPQMKTLPQRLNSERNSVKSPLLSLKNAQIQGEKRTAGLPKAIGFDTWIRREVGIV